MFASSLNSKIIIEKRSLTRDSIGHVTETWATLASRRAKVEHQSGVKNFQTDNEGETVTNIIYFTIRTLRELDYECRIIYEGQEYQIHDIEKFIRRNGHRIKCERIQNQR